MPWTWFHGCLVKVTHSLDLLPSLLGKGSWLPGFSFLDLVQWCMAKFPSCLDSVPDSMDLVPWLLGEGSGLPVSTSWCAGLGSGSGEGFWLPRFSSWFPRLCSMSEW